MKPDRQVYQAATHLRSQELVAFVAWLEAGREEIKEYLTTAQDGNTANLQGRAQMIKEILDLIETAPAMLEKKPGLIARFSSKT